MKVECVVCVLLCTLYNEIYFFVNYSNYLERTRYIYKFSSTKQKLMKKQRSLNFRTYIQDSWTWSFISNYAISKTYRYCERRRSLWITVLCNLIWWYIIVDNVIVLYSVCQGSIFDVENVYYMKTLYIEQERHDITKRLSERKYNNQIENLWNWARF